MTTYTTPTTWDQVVAAQAAGTLEQRREVPDSPWFRVAVEDKLRTHTGLSRYRIRAEQTLLLVPKEQLVAMLNLKKAHGWYDVDKIVLAIQKLLECPVHQPPVPVPQNVHPMPQVTQQAAAKPPSKGLVAAHPPVNPMEPSYPVMTPTHRDVFKEQLIQAQRLTPVPNTSDRPYGIFAPGKDLEQVTQQMQASAKVSKEWDLAEKIANKVLDVILDSSGEMAAVWTKQQEVGISDLAAAVQPLLSPLLERESLIERQAETCARLRREVEILRDQINQTKGAKDLAS